MNKLFLILALFAPAVAWAADGRLPKAERLLEEMEYEKALKMADRVLRSAGNGPAELVQALSIRGLCLAATGDQKASMETFRMLLAIDPAYRLPTTLSPRLTAGFYQAVAYAQSQKPITVVHRPPEVAADQAFDALAVTLLADPLGMVKSIRVRLRVGKRRKNVLAHVNGLGEVTVRLPRGFGNARLRYHVEALNGHGSILARLGARGDPLRPAEPGAQVPPDGASVALAPPLAAKNTSVAVTPPVSPKGADAAAVGPPAGPLAVKARPVLDAGAAAGFDGDEPVAGPARWYESWWFWTAVGVVVVGAAAGTAAALTADGPTRGPVNYGIELR